MGRLTPVFMPSRCFFLSQYILYADKGWSGLEQPVSVLLAWGAGLASFLSPCVLPLIPTYITYLAGSSLQSLRSGEMTAAVRARLYLNSVAFILGFSLIFIGMGLSASLLSQLIRSYQFLVQKISGLLIIFFGLHMMGFIKWDFLYREQKLNFQPKGSSPWGAFLIGVAFSAGWTPCVGPILSSILLYASTAEKAGTGAILLTAYSLGLAVPFFLTTVFISWFLQSWSRFSRYLGRINAVSGALLVLMGILVYTNYFSRLSGLLNWGF